jgi:hypothetical protein
MPIFEASWPINFGFAIKTLLIVPSKFELKSMLYFLSFLPLIMSFLKFLIF